ncbi:MAG TPA: transposase [Syntrophomonas sp.]|jgi:REP element-mobilizing transposase RayT|nr:transposase [Syntrophomonas sp.]
MPRTAREKSESGIYHIMLRGINQQNIFEDEEDNKKFIDILERYKTEIDYKIYAYCLMGNHVHLLVKEGKEELSNTMKRIGTAYVYWYNWQYGRKGHLFQDRYKSEAVENDRYFLTVLRYIHQNPIKAGLVKDIETYEWSSYKEYIGEKGIVDTDFVLSMWDTDRDKSIQSFIVFNAEISTDECLEVTEVRKTISDKEIKELVMDKYHLILASLQNQPQKTQAEVLKYLKELDGTSLRQISRLTGFTVNKIYRS